MGHEKHFSLNEAREILIIIKPVLLKMMELKKILDEKGFDIYRHQFFGGIGTNGTGKHPVELDELVECIRKITGYGIILKGIDNGLIDFPHIRANGEEVYLCYMYGETGILYWHSLSDGFKGRREIEEL